MQTSGHILSRRSVVGWVCAHLAAQGALTTLFYAGREEIAFLAVCLSGESQERTPHARSWCALPTEGPKDACFHIALTQGPQRKYSIDTRRADGSWQRFRGLQACRRSGSQ